MIRAFLAVHLADPLKAWLETIQSDLKRRMLHDLSRDAAISWVRPASLHVTMKFLGDIDEGLVRPLQDASPISTCARVPMQRLAIPPWRVQSGNPDLRLGIA